MPSSLTALGLMIALTFGGSSFAPPQPDGDTNAPAAVEDPNSDGAYLVATMALFGLVGLAGVTRRDYVRAHRIDKAMKRHPSARGRPGPRP